MFDSPSGRSHIIVEVSLSLIGQTSLGWTPLPSEELVVAQRRLPDKTQHPQETGDHPNPRSQQASGRKVAGIGDHEPWPAMLDINNDLTVTESVLTCGVKRSLPPIKTLVTDRCCTKRPALRHFYDFPHWTCGQLVRRINGAVRDYQQYFVRQLWRDAT